MHNRHHVLILFFMGTEGYVLPGTYQLHHVTILLQLSSLLVSNIEHVVHGGRHDGSCCPCLEGSLEGGGRQAGGPAV